LELVQVLLKGGGKATLNEQNKRGLSALGEAVAQGHAQVAEYLIKQVHPQVC
jgi:ankyrin repeat protein